MTVGELLPYSFRDLLVWVALSESRSLWPTNIYLHNSCTSYLGGSVMRTKQWLGLGLVAVATVGDLLHVVTALLDAASSSDVKTKAAIVTDTGGVLMTNHSTNQLGSLQRLGVEHNLSQKITVSLTSNQQEKHYALTTCNKRLEVTT